MERLLHPSHPHRLQLSATIPPSATCAACNNRISETGRIYTCTPCSFFLHASCSKFPELITRNSHPLSLLPTNGVFRCNACNQNVAQFGYRCQTSCDFNFHVLCAFPSRVTHPFHPEPLTRTFSYACCENWGFSCAVCGHTSGPDQWLYRCVLCNFNVHLHCATYNLPAPPPTQNHHYSFPGGVPVTGQGHLSGGHVQSHWQPSQEPVAVGGQSYPMPPQPPRPVITNQNGGLRSAMKLAGITGVAQQVVQEIVKYVIGGDDGDGDGGDGGIFGDGY
ncbi:hypothetical protein L2E82_10205 [Cichorium intybus]|uniref:Uncharacterized protein n=1 Tax=Cichorium intybus TaxID=13427 RepID=A0ACB9G9F4_CICIN|nr:hypothetical protein L2E82_10205 [Cichorium intybus]